MRSVLAVLLCAGLLGCAELGVAQDRGSSSESPESKPLSELIAMALRSNPDILIAEAKLKAAEAEANQVRLRVTREVVMVRDELSSTRQKLMYVHELRATDAAGDDAVIELDLALTRLASQLRYLIGSSAATAAPSEQDAPVEQANSAAIRPVPPLPQSVRLKLNATIRCEYADLPLSQILDEFGAQAGVAFVLGPELRVQDTAATYNAVRKITLKLGNVSIYTAMLAIADTYGYTFVVRDYGVLVTTPHHAMTIDAPKIPDSGGMAPAGGGGMF